ncbi:polyadenylate-binding protein-interacting protein 12-like [Phalaenopsis equestris]|uniref:polyadenylate-binding protein-interacting protein 12-like n=1 Tax=Phalaenopsis equestris TaxID=78828 RepID=UPI0009E39F5C|nr:polyadenylate-binding protein-interacting protein 12-like [Phalaenopsis equestris]
MAVVDNTDGSAPSVSRELNAGGGKEDESDHIGETRITVPVMRPHHESSFSDFQLEVFKPPMAQQRPGKAAAATSQLSNGGSRENGEVGFKQDMRDLEELLSKLNPMAAEFVPPSHTNYASRSFGDRGGGFVSNNVGIHGLYTNGGYLNGGYANGVNSNGGHRGRNGYSQGKRRMNNRTSMAQREDIIRRTVYVSDIDHQVTEEELAALFVSCGQVVDCRVCGDPNSVLRFAFVEFTDEDGARASLNISGTMLGFYPVRVLPSKTAIAPVDPKYLPRSEDEREMCTRTIYCTNIDSKITQAEVKLFFETVCGPVYRLRLLGDYHNATRIAFVEFARAESAIAALNCSGAVLGSFQLRVSPSKTPVRPRATRSHMS